MRVPRARGAGREAGWAVPTWPHEPPPGTAEPTLDAVESAYLTRVRSGPLRTVVTPTRWLTGAVHDRDGRLLPASQKVGGLGGNQGAQADPRRVPVRDGAAMLQGTWLYGGHWIGHFGHFLTETLTTLWPDRAATGEVDGLVFHHYFGRYAGIAPWQRELLALAGWAGLPIEVVDPRPVRVERLLLPGRSVVVNGWAHPQAREVWRRMAAAADPGPATRRVFVSRTAFNAARRAADQPVRTDAERDTALDRVFADAGFEVVAPQEHPIVDQVRLAAESAVLAGSAGTALHLSAVAPAGTRVLELGDTRSPDVPVPHQRVVDRVSDHPSIYLPHALTPDEVARRLRRIGLR